MTRPRIIFNAALSWDGKLTTANRRPADFSSSTDKARLVAIRRRADALIIGHTTLRTDNMAMVTPPDRANGPLRIIVSNSGNIASDLKVFRVTGPKIIIFTAAMPTATEEKISALGADIIRHEGAVSLDIMLEQLAKNYAVTTVICEGGGVLYDSFLRADLVDEIYLTTTPYIFGGHESPTITGTPADNFLTKSITWRLCDYEVIEGECFLRYTRRTN